MLRRLRPNVGQYCHLCVGLVALQLLSIGQVFASEGVDTSKSIKEVYMSLHFDDESAVSAFSKIESATDFTFSFNLVDVKGKRVSGHYENESLFNILMDLSRQLDLKFRQYRDVINVKPKKIIEKAEPVEIAEVASVFTVEGTVSNQEGEGLPGVNVLIKGTSNGTVTDINGNYTITAPSGDATLVFSFIGYVSEEIPINGRTVIDLTLAPDVETLQEVVVVGYGTQQKSDLTGSIATLSEQAIADRNTPQISTALQGAVPGLMVTRGDGSAPGSSATVRVRGLTTIGNNDPLVIIDGVPGSLDDTNPNDIASISVLKDAASASIYGSRAAAGVILITTKRAKSGQASFDYNYEFGIQKPTALPRYADPVTYMEIYNEAMVNDGDVPLWPQDVIDNYHSLHASDPDAYPITDWQDLLLKDYAPSHDHYLSFTMGSDKIKTKASVNYTSVDGLYEKRSFDRYSIRLNNDIQVNNFLSANFDLAYHRSEINNPQRGKELEPIHEARYIPPTDDDVYEDGRWAPGRTGMNVIATTVDGGFRTNITNQLKGRLAFTLKPVRGLSLSTIVAPTLNFHKNTSFLNKIEYTDRTSPSVIIFNSATEPVLQESRPSSFGLNLQVLANYSRQFSEDHDTNFLLGYEENYNSQEVFDASRTGGFILSNPYLDLGSPALQTNRGSFSEVGLRSMFGRLMYGFKGRYLLQLNGRFDGSSRFHEDHRWAFFPSVSAGWVISQESFMESLTPVNFLKVRGSWGVVGNERIGNYPYQASISFGNNLFYNGNQIVAQPTGFQSSYAIPDITWESTETKGVGLDFTILERLDITADYFQRTTRDILLTLDIPSLFGYSAPAQNAGSVSTKGWEFAANWNGNVGELGYTIGFNISDSRTKIVDLKGTQMLGSKAQLEGEEFDSWYGYKSAGLFQTADEVAGYPTITNTVKPGDVKYIDINEDGKITAEGDKVPLGGSLPRHLYGGQIRLDYKGFDLFIAMQGVGKVNSYLETVQVQALRGNYGSIPATILGKYWSSYNTTEQNAEAIYPRVTRTFSSNSFQVSDFWLIDGSYFRLKSVMLGYNLPQGISERMKLQGIRVYASANDLLTLHKFPKGWDPEVGATTYPIVTTFLAGINIKF